MLRNLRAVRNARKMTQGELAAASGINRVTIARYETDQQDATIENACRLAAVLGVTVDELIGKPPEGSTPGKNTPARPSPQDTTLQREAVKMDTDSELELLKRMLEGCEDSLVSYQQFANCGDPALEANYRHKVEQAERLREKIKKLQEEGKKGV